MPKYVSTCSTANVDARRDMDGFDINKELALLREALEEPEPPFAFIQEAFGNIDRFLQHHGNLPQRWQMAGGSTHDFVYLRFRWGLRQEGWEERMAADGFGVEPDGRPRVPTLSELTAMFEWLGVPDWLGEVDEVKKPFEALQETGTLLVGMLAEAGYLEPGQDPTVVLAAFLRGEWPQKGGAAQPEGAQSRYDVITE